MTGHRPDADTFNWQPALSALALALRLTHAWVTCGVAAPRHIRVQPRAYARVEHLLADKHGGVDDEQEPVDATGGTPHIRACLLQAPVRAACQALDHHREADSLMSAERQHRSR
ncbi:hypothetical protein CS8_034780 [Cupriavidus sp. 8B]